MPSTPLFQIPPKEYVRAAAHRRLLSLAWLPALVLAATAAAGFVDTRFWFFGLMLLLIIDQIAVSMEWLVQVGHPSLTLLQRPQTWSLSPDGLTIRFHDYRQNDDDETEPEVKESVTFPPQAVDDADYGRKLTLVPVPENPHKIKFLLIPSELFSALTSDYYAT